MAAGDAFRAWFPGMVIELRKFWKPDMKWNEVIDFCNQMTVLRTHIRKEQGIKPAIITCRKCGTKGESIVPDISPRSLLFTLKKIELISDELFKYLERGWIKYQKSNNIDAYGNKKKKERNKNGRATVGSIKHQKRSRDGGKSVNGLQ
jgi:hypothetical protein